MKKWILFGLLGLLLIYILTRREGFQDTVGIKGVYDLDDPDPMLSSARHVIELMPNTLIKALQDAKPTSPCPTATDQLKQCPADPTTGAGMMTLLGGDINDIMVSFYTNVYQSSNANLKSSDVDTFLTTYPMTPFLTANKEDVRALLIAYFVTQTPGSANSGTNDRRLVNDTAPDSSASAALGARYNNPNGWSDKSAMERSASYAQTSGYSQQLDEEGIQDAANGPLPDAIDERTGNTDFGATRPMIGDVFGDNGPFSGNAGTGQGTGMNAAAGITGSSYGYPPPTEGHLDPYDLWPGSGSQMGGSAASAPPGTKQPVNGPSWGGTGTSTFSGSSVSSSQPAPALYGPSSGDKSKGLGWGHSQKNSGDTTAIPDSRTAGSDPSNRFAVTSRVPGDQDMFGSMYTQSDTYSFTNGSQKTDPVPFLTDFSAFQK
uniref:Uncharacterized protein n=1 Tax=viral metagenome TaxID=1070528 RepID=A0A6C0AJP0_9ZZZZ